MSRRTLLSLAACATVVAVLVTMIPTAQSSTVVSPHARIPIDPGNICQENCCGSSGGQIQQTQQGGSVCHINESDPAHDMKVSMFNSCANGCAP